MPIHPFSPTGLNEKTKILILGSFPSIASREMGFYYAHPQNRFWKVLEALFQEKNMELNFITQTNFTKPLVSALQNTTFHNIAEHKQNIPLHKQTIAIKTAFLKTHFLALWDIVHSCEIQGSSDSSLKNIVFNDVFSSLHSSKIQNICLNGTKASIFFKTYCKNLGFPLKIETYPYYKIFIPTKPLKFSHEIRIFSLPSTSPANAKYNLNNLLDSWKILKEM